MAGDSGSPFTVTFGRSGRVVKRSGDSSDSGYSGSGPALGSKRSVKDRLGTSGIEFLDDRNPHKYKRPRGENNQASWNKNRSDDTHLDRGDLRYKILQKNVSIEVDLRDKLSRKTTLPPGHSNRSHLPEAADGTRKDMLNPRDSYSGGRQSMREPRDAYVQERQTERELQDAHFSGRHSMLDLGNAYDHGRQGMVGPRDGYDHGKHIKQCVPEPSKSYNCERQGALGSVPSSRTLSNVAAVDLVRSSKQFRILDNIRQRSPDRVLYSSTTRTSSPGRNVEELQKRALIRTHDDGKSNLYRRNDIPSSPRAVRSATFLTQPALHAVSHIPAKPAQLVAQYPQTSGVAQKISYPGELPTVDGLLQSLGLEKYAIHFKAEEVDFKALRQMNETDLKELGIPMGPRKKIIQALRPQLRR